MVTGQECPVGFKRVLSVDVKTSPPSTVSWGAGEMARGQGSRRASSRWGRVGKRGNGGERRGDTGAVLCLLVRAQVCSHSNVIKERKKPTQKQPQESPKEGADKL